jgi:membrane protease YdiL (CAAX protease family)
MNKFHRYQLHIFFLIAFGITWAVQIPAYIFAHKHGFQLTNEANFLNFIELLKGNLDADFSIVLLLFTFAFGPTLAGIIVTALTKGKAGLKNLVSMLTKILLPFKWVVIYLSIPVLLIFISTIFGMVVGGLKPIEFQFLVPLALSIPFLLFMIIFTGLAEEVGWRGYALPQLQAKFSAEKSSWILGILWGLWHLPSNLMMPLLRGELQIGVVVSVLLALTVGIVGWTIVLTWLFNNTRSLFWIIVMHGLTNTLQSYLILSSNNYPANLFYALLPWAFAIFLLKKYGSQTLIAKHAS